MPSGGLRSIEMNDAEAVTKIAREAAKHGLFVEWIAFFIGGIQDGVEPKEAAHLAAGEWDF